MKAAARLRGGNRYLRTQESACLNAETFKKLDVMSGLFGIKSL